MDTYMALGEGNWEGRGGVTPRYTSTRADKLKERLDSQKRKKGKNKIAENINLYDIRNM
jgi:hypothetical protein